MKSQVILPGDLTACNLKGHSVHQVPQKLSGSRILNVDKSDCYSMHVENIHLKAVRHVFLLSGEHPYLRVLDELLCAVS